MNELLIILKVIGMIVISLIGFAIFFGIEIPFKKKSEESKLWRFLFFLQGFILIAIWGRTWDWQGEEGLTMYWTAIILGLMFFLVMNYIMPTKEPKTGVEE